MNLIPVRLPTHLSACAVITFSAFTHMESSASETTTPPSETTVAETQITPAANTKKDPSGSQSFTDFIAPETEVRPGTKQDYEKYLYEEFKKRGITFTQEQHKISYEPQISYVIITHELRMRDKIKEVFKEIDGTRPTRAKLQWAAVGIAPDPKPKLITQHIKEELLFDNASIEDVIAAFEDLSKAYDPMGIGISINYVDNSPEGSPPVSPLSLGTKGIVLDQDLRLVAKRLNLQYYVEEGEIFLRKGVPVVSTRVYKINPDQWSRFMKELSLSLDVTLVQLLQDEYGLSKADAVHLEFDSKNSHVSATLPKGDFEHFESILDNLSVSATSP